MLTYNWTEITPTILILITFFSAVLLIFTEKGDVKVKIETLKKVIQLILNGEKMPSLLMHVIKFLMPLQDHTIKKLLLIFWEIIPKTGPDGKLLHEMILVCDAYRKVCGSHKCYFHLVDTWVCTFGFNFVLLILFTTMFLGFKKWGFYLVHKIEQFLCDWYCFRIFNILMSSSEGQHWGSYANWRFVLFIIVVMIIIITTITIIIIIIIISSLTSLL